MWEMAVAIIAVVLQNQSVSNPPCTLLKKRNLGTSIYVF
jgi:hypothetical protein